MNRVILFVQTDDYDVGLVFAWDEVAQAWVCKMEDGFMKELGPLLYEEKSA